MFATTGRVKPLSAALVALTAVALLASGMFWHQVVRSPAASAAKVTEPVWRGWVFDRMVEHRNALQGKIAIITTRYKDSAGDSLRIDVKWDPASGALHAEARWPKSGYGYTVACQATDVCWYHYRGTQGEGAWVAVPAGRIQMQELVTHPNDLISAISTKSDVTTTQGVRRGIGSPTSFPTDTTYEVVTVRGKTISYRYLGKYMIGKRQSAGWSDTTWRSTVGPDASTFVPPIPAADEVVPAPWGPRVITFEHF